jgi:hypothetical protein
LAHRGVRGRRPRARPAPAGAGRVADRPTVARMLRIPGTTDKVRRRKRGRAGRFRRLREGRRTRGSPTLATSIRPFHASRR